MGRQDPDFVQPSPLSKVRLPFERLARAVRARNPRAFAETLLALALELNREPTPQELWDRLRRLYPAIARDAHKRTRSATKQERRPSSSAYTGQLATHLEDPTLRHSLLDTPSAGQIASASGRDGRSILEALKDALPRPKRPRPRRQQRP